MSKRLAFAVYVFSIIFFSCFFIWPIWEIVRSGFFDYEQGFTLAYFKAVFINPIYREGLFNSFVMGIGSTILALFLAIPLAYLFNYYEFPGKKLFSSLILLPIMLPPFVGAIGIQQLLGTYGIINTALIRLGWMSAMHPFDWLGSWQFTSIIILNALSLYPVVYLNIVASLANIDPAMEEAAANLGCRRFRNFFHITFPLIRPGVFAGCTIVFIWAFTELGVPLMFNFNRVTSVQIFNGLKEIGGNPFPYALVTVMFILSALFYLIGKGLFGRNNYEMLSKASHGRVCKKLGVGGQCACVCFFTLVTVLALLPHLTVVLFSFASDWYQSILPNAWTMENYRLALGNDLTIPSIENSLIYASCATLLSVFLGIGIAFVVARTRLPGRHLLDVCAMMPLAVPGLVMAFGFVAMSQEGRVFSFLNPVDNPTVLLIIAYAIRKLPLMVRSGVAGLQQTSIKYEEAAQSLGCPPFKSVRKITLPLIMANLMAGSILVFSQAMLEVSDSLILAQKQSFYPITKSIYELLNLLGHGTFLSCALGVWAMTFLAITIISTAVLLGKGLGAIFKV
ncbi:MAG: iron ABC transporter permease [Puniceicoccales bacterium]|jgi:iron(III) transport system permease protein|nr:iron ABC transporter permease [Puniceicoccales bacterium]